MDEMTTILLKDTYMIKHMVQYHAKQINLRMDSRIYATSKSYLPSEGVVRVSSWLWTKISSMG
jgi:hypothetical protein